ncbi:hypothetical protein ABPG74_001914 [Tetrahymena malaccensis]
MDYNVDCQTAYNNGLNVCLMGQATDFNQNDINKMKNYFQDQQCLQLTQLDPQNLALSGDNLLSGRKSCQKLLSQVKKIKRLVKSKIIIGEQEGGTEDSDIEDSENEDQDQNYLSDQNEQFIEDSD